MSCIHSLKPFFPLCLILTGGWMMTAGLAQAGQRSVDEAQVLASKHFEKNATPPDGKKTPVLHCTAQAQLAYTALTGGQTAYYVFNNAASEGFVIINGADSGREILGYCSTQTFCQDSLPDNLRWWLHQYEAQFAYAEHNWAKETVDPMKARAEEDGTVEDGTEEGGAEEESEPRRLIPTMISAKWGQSAPYNYSIPLVTEDYGRLLTGCVATAMSQLMYYYHYPANGYGEHQFSKTFKIDEETEQTVEFEADFAHTYYQWDLMLDVYKSGECTKEQCYAVADLMYQAGVSVDMDYGLKASSAKSKSVREALVKYFGFDEGLKLDWLKNHSTAEWDEMIYHELDEGRPVLYFGYDTNGQGGHIFIVNGYDPENDLYDINWGWKGNYDGYYALSLLNPIEDKYNFSSGEGACFGAKPHATATGDANADKHIDVGDIVTIRASVEMESVPVYDIKAADANHDLNVDDQDIELLQEIILSNEDEYDEQ